MRNIEIAGLIGEGADKVVSLDAKNPDKVIARWQKETVSQEEAKAAYYFGKLIHLLFPEHTPDVDQAGHDGIAYVSIERLHPDSAHTAAERIFNSENSSAGELEEATRHVQERRSDPRVQQLISDMRRAGLNPSDSGINYGINPNTDKAIYLDSPYAFELRRDSIGTYALDHFDRNALQTAINQLPVQQQARAQNYLTRIFKLEEDLINKQGK